MKFLKIVLSSPSYISFLQQEYYLQLVLLNDQKLFAGSMRLIAALVDGRWDPAEFLVVPPGHQTAGVYDWDEVVRAKPA